jgi:hypothetical protein
MDNISEEVYCEGKGRGGRYLIIHLDFFERIKSRKILMRRREGGKEGKEVV